MDNLKACQVSLWRKALLCTGIPFAHRHMDFACVKQVLELSKGFNLGKAEYHFCLNVIP